MSVLNIVIWIQYFALPGSSKYYSNTFYVDHAFLWQLGNFGNLTVFKERIIEKTVRVSFWIFSLYVFLPKHVLTFVSDFLVALWLSILLSPYLLLYQQFSWCVSFLWPPVFSSCPVPRLPQECDYQCQIKPFTIAFIPIWST